MFWPRERVPYGFMTGIANGDIREGHGFTHWSTMFNVRQMLVHTQLLRAIMQIREFHDPVPFANHDYVLGAFQQYLRNQNLFTIWNPQRDYDWNSMFSHEQRKFSSLRATAVENSVFAHLGRGQLGVMRQANTLKGAMWSAQDLGNWLPTDRLRQLKPALAADLKGKSEKGVLLRIRSAPVSTLECVSATDLSDIQGWFIRSSSHGSAVWRPTSLFGTR